MSEAVWDKAFTQGSRALQDRLKKVHAKNPKFQAWLQKSGHGAGASVKQASKEVKATERVKKLQAKSLAAYGATKGVKVGGEHGSDEVRDTIAPLTRDQHSKVQAAERASKAAAKAAAPKAKKPLSKAQRMAAIAAAVRKSKTKHDVPTVDPDDMDHDDLRDLHQSLHVSRAYNEEVESVEEGVATAQKVADRANVVAKTNPDPKKRFAASGLAQKAMLRTINPTGVNTGIVRGGGNKTYRILTGKVPPYQLTKKTGVSEEVAVNEGKMKDIVTNRKETERLKAQDVLGGTVKTRTGEEPKGKLPLGFRAARNLARKAMNKGAPVTEGYEYTNIGHPPEHSVDVDPMPASDPLKLSTKRKKPVQYKSGMKDGVRIREESTEETKMSKGKLLAKAIMAKQSKHPLAQNMGEEVKDVADVGEYDYEGDMAKSQLRSILANAKRLHDMLEDQTNLPEWVQSKITLAEDYILTAANYMEGEMNEETIRSEEAIFEAMKKMADEMDDEEDDDMEDDEEVDQTDEAVRVVDRFYPGVPHDDQKRKDIAATVKKIRKDPDARGGMTGFNRYQDFFGGRNARLGAERTPVGEEVEQIDEQSPAEIKAKYYHDQFDKVKPVKAYDKEGKLVGHYRSMAQAKQMKPGHTYKEVKEEVVTEAEGKVAVTPKEKELAAHHGDPKKITYGDVIKARIKSAAEKAMNKGK